MRFKLSGSRAIVLVGGLLLSAPDRADAQGRVAEASVRAHMEMLAGDALNGRGSGTRDEWLAASYVASQLMQWGIEPPSGATSLIRDVATDRVELVAPPTLRTGSLTFSHGREMFVRSFGTLAVSGPLVRFLPGTRVAPGSVILVVGPEAPPADVSAGAVAVIEAETPELRLAWAAAAATTAVTAPAGRPWRVVVDAAAFLALTRVADGSTVSLEALARPGRTWNVVGRIPGSDRRQSDEVILLSAHLDHLGSRGTGADTIYNGADDDASGITAVLEIARALATGRRPRRTVMFAFFGSEETGGFGSRAFVAAPPVPLDRIVVNLQFEMIGRPDQIVPPRTLWLTGFERSTLGPELARRGARLVADPHPDQQFFFRSDNIRFAYAGVVAHTVSSFGLHEDYHSPRDEVAGIDFVHMTDAIESLRAPISWLANSTFVPAWHDGQQPKAGPTR
jgi:aminopeptidase YwaD